MSKFDSFLKTAAYLANLVIEDIQKQGNQHEENIEENPQNNKRELRDWSTILGVTKNATNDEIKSAYKRKISAYHPDKLASLGENYRALAEEDSKEINQAYQEIRAERGF